MSRQKPLHRRQSVAYRRTIRNVPAEPNVWRRAVNACRLGCQGRNPQLARHCGVNRVLDNRKNGLNLPAKSACRMSEDVYILRTPLLLTGVAVAAERRHGRTATACGGEDRARDRSRGGAGHGGSAER